MAKKSNKKVKTNKVKNVNTITEERLSEDAKNLIKTSIIVVASFGVCYLLFMLLDKVGMFDKGYEKPDAPQAEFTYNTAIVGTVFNRPESVYYVAFDEEDGNSYFDTLLNLYEGDIQIYKVNMSLGINADYKGAEGNYKAKTPNELSIAGPTLIKISKGKIVTYLDEIEKIEKELNN